MKNGGKNKSVAFIFWSAYIYIFLIKIPNVGFTILGSLSEKQFLKNHFLSVSTIKNCWNGNIMWKFEVLYGTTNANKEPLF